MRNLLTAASLLFSYVGFTVPTYVASDFSRTTECAIRLKPDPTYERAGHALQGAPQVSGSSRRRRGSYRGRAPKSRSATVAPSRNRMRCLMLSFGLMKMPAACVFIEASNSVVGGTFGTGTSSGQIITMT